MGYTAFRGHERHNEGEREGEKNIHVHVIQGACGFTLLQLLSCQTVLLLKETLQGVILDFYLNKRLKNVMYRWHSPSLSAHFVYEDQTNHSNVIRH